MLNRTGRSMLVRVDDDDEKRFTKVFMMDGEGGRRWKGMTRLDASVYIETNVSALPQTPGRVPAAITKLRIPLLQRV